MKIFAGFNVPVIIKYLFRQTTAENSEAVYAFINYGQAVCPKKIEAPPVGKTFSNRLKDNKFYVRVRNVGQVYNVPAKPCVRNHPHVKQN